MTEAEIIQGEWIDSDAGRVNFGDYAAAWIEERPGLRPKTIELYGYLLRRHLLPAFGRSLVADIREPQVRRWRKERLDSGISAVTVAKAYRLLKAIMNTAAEDGMIRKNPCRIKGASVETSPERPVLSISQVYDLAEAIDPRYQALVLLAVFGSMRWGELAALRRCDQLAGESEPAKLNSIGHTAGTEAPERFVKIGYGHVESVVGLGI